MVVIDDCFVTFFGDSLPMTQHKFLEQSKKKLEEKIKKLKVYSSLMSTTLDVMS
jgi:hypothetical protein